MSVILVRLKSKKNVREFVGVKERFCPYNDSSSSVELAGENETIVRLMRP